MDPTGKISSAENQRVWVRVKSNIHRKHGLAFFFKTMKHIPQSHKMSILWTILIKIGHYEVLNQVLRSYLNTYNAM